MSKLKLTESHKFLYEKLGASTYETFISMEAKLKEEEKPAEVTETKPLNLVMLSSNLRGRFKKEKDVDKKLEAAVDICLEVKKQVASGKKLSIGTKRCPGYTQLYQYGRIVHCFHTCYRGKYSCFLRSHPRITLRDFKCPKGEEHTYKFKPSK